MIAASTRALALLVVATATAGQAPSDGPAQASQAEAQKACEVAAITDYLKAKSLLLQQAAPLPSVQQIIEQRRLEEQYCLRSVRCGFREGNDSDHNLLSLELASLFNSCLRDDEALETYRTKPRVD
jgi:hypothetical protein